MKVDSITIAKVFSNGGDIHYVLPPFQRHYAWKKDNWHTLLDDALKIYDVYQSDNEPEHFLGALVVIPDGMRSGTLSALKLVDGQQRLTTISLVLCVLARIVVDSNPKLYKNVRKLLINEDETSDVRYKLLPTTKYNDRNTYKAIIEGHAYPENSSRIAEAFEYLYKQIDSKKAHLDLERLYLVFANCMHVVYINLDQRERPYEIFESLNAKGEPLTQPDLIRNYIAMRLPERQQQMVFDKHWSVIESWLHEDRTVARIGEITAFLRHYLGMQTGTLPNQDHVYARFRDRMEREYIETDAFVGEIATLHRFASDYNRLLRPEAELDADIRTALKRLNIVEATTAYPFLLWMFEQYRTERIDRMTLLDGLSVIENYIIRRFLAGESSNYTNRMFPTLPRNVDVSRFSKSLRQFLSRRDYPSDARIRQSLLTAQLYDERRKERLILILESINRHLSATSGGYTVLDNSATIEHVMPQTLNETWRQEIGEDWEDVYDDYLHTLGNLTLVTATWNSSLSNAAFAEKQKRLAQHGLRLNQSNFGMTIPRWNKDAILERTRRLTDLILDIWSPFEVTTESVSTTGRSPSAITILGETHPVNSWRDVAIQMAEAVATLTPDKFDAIALSMPTYFKREMRTRSRQLNNGWWLYINLSSESVMNLCNRLIVEAGLDDDDWAIEIE